MKTHVTDDISDAHLDSSKSFSPEKHDGFKGDGVDITTGHVVDSELGHDEQSVRDGTKLTREEAVDEAIGHINEVYTIDSDNSPFPEVRANVPNTDDMSTPVNTFRAWFLGIIFTMLGAGINQFFSMRYPSVQISSLVAQLVAFPIGRGLAKVLPIKTVSLFGHKFLLNHDHHFNIKEHALVTIMSNLSFGASWATDIIQAQKAFYHSGAPVGYQFFLGLSMQLFGLGLAGLSYRFIVEPPQMIWPATLANAALFETLHSRANPMANGWQISRYRFFLYVFGAGFCWYWFPGFIFTGLSTFAFICWAAPSGYLLCINDSLMLIPSRQFRRQQSLRNVHGPGMDSNDIRLVAGRIQWFSLGRSFLGSSKRLRWLGPSLRCNRTYNLLHKHMVSSSRLRQAAQR